MKIHHEDLKFSLQWGSTIKHTFTTEIYLDVFQEKILSQNPYIIIKWKLNAEKFRKILGTIC